jgi:hypothetical protein
MVIVEKHWVPRNGAEHGRTLKAKYLGKFKNILEISLDHKLGDSVSYFDEKNWSLKISCYCLFNISFRKYLPAFCLRLTEC